MIKDVKVGDKLSYYRIIGEKYIDDYEIVKITYKYDTDTGHKYSIYHVYDDDDDTIIKCDSRTGEEVGNDMWYFTKLKEEVMKEIGKDLREIDEYGDEYEMLQREYLKCDADINKLLRKVYINLKTRSELSIKMSNIEEPNECHSRKDNLSLTIPNKFDGLSMSITLFDDNQHQL